MVELDATLTLPFRQIPDGTIRIGDTRVSLETIIDSYLLGQRPEEIHSGFPFIDLADIHAIIAYYLKNREAVDRYLAEQEADSQRILGELADLNAQRASDARQAFIPDDLSYMTDTDFGQTMLGLAEEIAKEQGTRTTEEIGRLVKLMRGSNLVNADLP
jgi:uncharacterized protein (DUF433 family)